MRCPALVLVCLLFALPVPAKELVITFGGDVNFNRNGQAPQAGGLQRFGKTYDWPDLTGGIDHLFDGDLNFINLETVLTDRPDLEPAAKKYVFRSHPDAMKHLVDLGVNLVALANNHAYDYGYEGYGETLSNLEHLPVETAGVGHAPRIFKPTVFAWQDVVVAFNAMTFMEVPFPATHEKPGVLDANNPAHWNGVISAFAKSKADIKILSLHKGLEREIGPEPGLRTRLRKAVADGDLNLVLAHHPHVARAVERADDDTLIFYGLGNLLMAGARDMGPLDDARDFGLFGRVFLKRSPERQWRFAAAQVTPLTDMHLKPRPMSHRAATRRITHLNRLGQKTSGKKAVRFDVRADATGVACFGRHPAFLCEKGLPAKPLAKPVAKPVVRPSGSPRVYRQHD